MDNFKTWLEGKEGEQNKTSGFSAPVFTSEEVYEKIFSLQDKAASIKRIPKPKPKVEKPVKNETETNSENAKTSDSTPEKDTSQNDKPAGDSDSSTNEEVNVESEPHDEL
ncbi:heat shock 70 kDa protein 17-like [Herrania umbratica]|uniref:Heat shock 70 kDa protein 17-like n=1 Tax=Herrania umbratica TaxID=108875 RepID=A0A6J1BB30_9ROSI|nr:heat shock 70 kDa protein 17-like [Herrania umbratica]